MKTAAIATIPNSAGPIRRASTRKTPKLKVTLPTEATATQRAASNERRATAAPEAKPRLLLGGGGLRQDRRGGGHGRLARRSATSSA